MDERMFEQVDSELVRRVDRAFDNELMCSQVTFLHGARKLGFDEETALLAASGFGWGMQNGERCGAVTGSLMALGLRFGYRNLEEFPNYRSSRRSKKSSTADSKRRWGASTARRY